MKCSKLKITGIKYHFSQSTGECYEAGQDAYTNTQAAFIYSHLINKGTYIYS